MRNALLSCFVASCIIVAAVLGAITVAGCTTVTNPDGSTSRVLGFESPEAQSKAQDTVNTVAAYLPPPFNTIAGAIGTAIVAGIGAYAAKKKGEENGWDMAHAESPTLGGKPATPPAPSAPAS